jgi:CTD small phosphatase-like protein 2
MTKTFADENSMRFQSLMISWSPFCRYNFIKSLPPLTKEQLARPFVLPRKTRSSPKITLVLDLDETLVHCATSMMENSDIAFPVQFNEQTFHVSGKLRPHCRDFLERTAAMFEVCVLVTSSLVLIEAPF